VAAVTYDILRDVVPNEVGGVAFLSGGHRTSDACDFLAALNRLGPAPWPLTFSFGRALVNDALRVWAGSPDHVGPAQEALLANCRRAAGATAGRLAA
jgi:fructose-bisphosphate aldolase class I